ncbi:phosphotriesterase [Streptomyces sp. NBC_00872]|uniref:phosphotriesterase family protein n=1 Tax=Streptomyces sp. NBC_00872 TaxID=2903686 RepID=UPI0038688394|nr:phosphotriesterase [Streptomyces sp. NBC_00872]
MQHHPGAHPPAPHTSRQLRTVAGSLPVSAVRGPALAHEHLVLDLDRAGDGAAVLDTVRHRSAVTAELCALRAEFGLGLVIELTCRGMGRDPRALARIAEESGVAVVAATGWYYEPFHPDEIRGASVAQLTETLVREITDGFSDKSADGPADEFADGSGAASGSGASAGAGSGASAGAASGVGAGSAETRIRPGVLGEIGSHGDRPSEPETRALLASAHAALATGLSLATHAQLGRGALAQLELLTGTGLAPHRISLGHQDLLDDPAVHRELAASGAYVAFDTVGKESYQSDDTRLRLLLSLLEAGHADRILLSGDISRHGYLESEGGQGYGHLFRSFLPKARAAGVDDSLIDLMTRRNPVRFLTGADTDVGTSTSTSTGPDAEEI